MTLPTINFRAAAHEFSQRIARPLPGETGCFSTLKIQPEVMELGRAGITVQLFEGDVEGAMLDGDIDTRGALGLTSLTYTPRDHWKGTGDVMIKRVIAALDAMGFDYATTCQLSRARDLFAGWGFHLVRHDLHIPEAIAAGKTVGEAAKLAPQTQPIVVERPKVGTLHPLALVDFADRPQVGRILERPAFARNYG